MKKALDYYEKRGLTLQAVSQKIAGVEIDLVFVSKTSLFLVEVKSVASMEQLERLSVSGQMKRLRRAHEYYQELHIDREVQSELFVLESGEKVFVFEGFLA